jgi:hypothetical protein
MAKMTGILFDIDLSEYDWEIDEAVVTKSKIALDWEENGELFHLLAVSHDEGCTYSGKYGSPQPNPDWTMELTRYTAVDRSVFLVAYWHQTDTGNEGSCVFQLAEHWD